MALEFRNGRPYYYRNRRQGRKVVRQYVASGHLALVAAEQDARQREQRRAREAAEEHRRSEYEAARGPLLDLVAEAETLSHAVLIDAGYHRQNRGPWRRKTT